VLQGSSEDELAATKEQAMKRHKMISPSDM